MNVENTEGGSMRPVRRTEKLVVREVGNELVAYALDTETVTAIDPDTSAVWAHLDGTRTVEQIAARTQLPDAEVEQAIDRLDRAGLIAGGIDRRRFIRFAAGGAGAATLLAIAAPAAIAAGSSRALKITAIPSCSVTDNSGMSRSATITVEFTGTGYPSSGTVNISCTFSFGGAGMVPAAQTLATGTFASTASFTRSFSFIVSNTNNRTYAGRSFSIVATDSLSVTSAVTSVTATTAGAGSLTGSC